MGLKKIHTGQLCENKRGGKFAPLPTLVNAEFNHAGGGGLPVKTMGPRKSIRRCRKMELAHSSKERYKHNKDSPYAPPSVTWLLLFSYPCRFFFIVLAVPHPLNILSPPSCTSSFSRGSTGDGQGKGRGGDGRAGKTDFCRRLRGLKEIRRGGTPGLRPLMWFIAFGAQ